MSDVVYVSNTCSGCIPVKNALARSPIAGVVVRNIDTDPSARAAFNQTGTRVVPTAVVAGQVCMGAAQILGALRARYGRP